MRSTAIIVAPIVTYCGTRGAVGTTNCGMTARKNTSPLGLVALTRKLEIEREPRALVQEHLQIAGLSGTVVTRFVAGCRRWVDRSRV
jgi:hypothetical protein